MAEQGSAGAPGLDLEKFRQMLQQERRRLLKQLDRPTDEEARGESVADTQSELSDYPDHPADQGTETFEFEKEMSLKANARDLLEQAEDALRKMDNGTYGICSSCHKPIPERRLEVLPSAVYCVPCQSKLEGF